MENARQCAQDSLYALLVSYLVDGTRNILSGFDPSGGEDLRKVVVDGITFKIVKRVQSQSKEIPGINLVFFDEFPYGVRTNPQQLQCLTGIHIYLPVSGNIQADAKTIGVVERKIDEALYGGAVDIVDFYVSPVVLRGKSVSWSVIGDRGDWRELTNLEFEGFIHRAKNLNVWYDDDPIT